MREARDRMYSRVRSARRASPTLERAAEIGCGASRGRIRRVTCAAPRSAARPRARPVLWRAPSFPPPPPRGSAPSPAAGSTTGSASPAGSAARSVEGGASHRRRRHCASSSRTRCPRLLRRRLLLRRPRPRRRRRLRPRQRQPRHEVRCRLARTGQQAASRPRAAAVRALLAPAQVVERLAVVARRLARARPLGLRLLLALLQRPLELCDLLEHGLPLRRGSGVRLHLLRRRTLRRGEGAVELRLELRRRRHRRRELCLQVEHLRVPLLRCRCRLECAARRRARSHARAAARAARRAPLRCSESRLV